MGPIRPRSTRPRPLSSDHDSEDEFDSLVSAGLFTSAPDPLIASARAIAQGVLEREQATNRTVQYSPDFWRKWQGKWGKPNLPKRSAAYMSQKARTLLRPASMSELVPSCGGAAQSGRPRTAGPRAAMPPPAAAPVVHTRARLLRPASMSELLATKKATVAGKEDKRERLLRPASMKELHRRALPRAQAERGLVRPALLMQDMVPRRGTPPPPGPRGR